MIMKTKTNVKAGSGLLAIGAVVKIGVVVGGGCGCRNTCH
jgi:hypothetical protein